MTARQLILLALPLSFILVSSIDAYAQDEGFTADRPGATTGVDVLPKGRLQLESGFALEHTNLDAPSENKWTFNTSMLRWGFSDYAELRLQAAWLNTNGKRIRARRILRRNGGIQSEDL